MPAAGFELHTISVEGLSRTNPLRARCAPSRGRRWRCPGPERSLQASWRPTPCMGGGGYVAGPVGLGRAQPAHTLVLTEADSHLGLTNRLLAPGAKAGLPGLSDRRPRCARALPCHRPPDPCPAMPTARARGHTSGSATQETCVLVFGGSLGARSINLAAVAGACRDVEVAVCSHVAGGATIPSCGRAELPAGYDLREYLDLEEFATALAAADLVARQRAGGSVFEIAAYGLPAILVPYPHAVGDHQSANARWMTEAGAAIDDPRRAS